MEDADQDNNASDEEEQKQANPEEESSQAVTVRWSFKSFLYLRSKARW